jgi:hypothetical protein
MYLEAQQARSGRYVGEELVEASKRDEAGSEESFITEALQCQPDGFSALESIRLLGLCLQRCDSSLVQDSRWVRTERQGHT